MEIKKKKSVLPVDGASYWLQIWTAASSLDVKGNKATKKKIVFIVNRFVLLNMATCLWSKKKEEGTLAIHSFSNIRGSTSRRIYRLALPLLSPATLSSASKFSYV